MKKLPLFILLQFLLFLACAPTTTQETKEETEAPVVVDELDAQIAQMLLVGFRGTEIDEKSTIWKDVKDRNIGGVILYEYDNNTKSTRNIASSDQVKKLVSDLQALSKTPLFVAIDEEGGRVTRMKAKYGFEEGISAQKIGEINQEDSTRYWSSLIARKLAFHGINVNFAPVVDVNVNPTSPAIGNIERSYSADPAEVAKHAAWVIEEHRKEGVLSCLKHFPGHGSAAADSHKGITDVSKTWKPLELAPYKALIEQGKVDMIMTAHVFNEQLDPDFPATLSKKVMADKLRGDLGFKGMLVSDDMEMKAISSHYGLSLSLEKAINAGVDFLIFSNNIPGIYNENIAEKVIKEIRKLVDEGKISKERILEANERIAALKKGKIVEGIE